MTTLHKHLKLATLEVEVAFLEVVFMEEVASRAVGFLEVAGTLPVRRITHLTIPTLLLLVVPFQHQAYQTSKQSLFLEVKQLHIVPLQGVQH